MKKYAIIITCDPNNKDEALGKLLNAFAITSSLKKNDVETRILFQGAGTRWISILENKDHIAHPFYINVFDKIAGASAACAHAFGADVKTVPLLSDLELPGLGGATDIYNFMKQGYELLIF